MLNRRVNEDRREGRNGLVAVAIDRDRFSQYALKWATENILSRHQTVKLVHVIHRSSSSSSSSSNHNSVGNDEELIEQHPDIQTLEVFLPFRCFCTRRHLQCEPVVLQRQDVARALIEYVSQYGVETLLLGAPSKNGLTRLFKATDIPSTVLKWAPDFCNIYIVSKEKCHAVRSATRPVPPILVVDPEPTPSSITNEPVTISHDEFSTPDMSESFINSGRASTDSTFFAFYENLGLNLARRGSESRPPVNLNTLPELPSSSFDSGRTSYSSQNTDDLDNEIKRLRMELKQTVDMYHAACKEAFAAKQKVIQMEQCKIKEEKKLQEAQVAEQREKAKYKAAIEAAEAAQNILKLEVQKRVNAEIKALKEAEEKTKVLEAMGKSHMVLKYQCFFHIFVVLFLFYFYFCLLR